MKSQFETEVATAWAVFLTTVIRAAERESIEVIHAAFGRIAVPRDRAAILEPAAVIATPRRRPSAKPAERTARARRPRTAANVDEVRARVVARIGQVPGSTASQLGEALGLHGDTVRRYLRQLTSQGMVRSEEHGTGFGVLRRRVFFPVQSSEGNHIPSVDPPRDPPMFSVGGAA